MRSHTQRKAFCLCHGFIRLPVQTPTLALDLVKLQKAHNRWLKWHKVSNFGQTLIWVATVVPYYDCPRSNGVFVVPMIDIKTPTMVSSISYRRN